MTGYRSLEDALTRGRGNERMFLCPAHDDHSPSASVNVAKGVWYCYTCHASGKVGDSGYELPDEEFAEMVEDLLEVVEPRVYPEAWLTPYLTPHPYWLARMSEAAVYRYQFGFDPVAGCPVYPMRDLAGRLLGVVQREPEGPDGPKYRYPTHVVKSRYLFGYDPRSQVETVVLAEGATDVAACHDAGIPAVGTYGSVLHPVQLLALRRIGVETVVIGYDMDLAGHKGAEKARMLLKSAGIECWRPAWDPLLGDLSKMPLERRRDVLGL